MKSVESLQLCDACCEGYLHPKIRTKNEEYKGASGQIDLHYSVCDNCGSELLDAADLLNNKREWVRFKKKVDGVPLGAEIAEMRKRHHLTQHTAAEIFGGGPVAFSKYENDDLIPDEAMVSLLKLAIAYPETIKNLANVKGVALFAKQELSNNVTYLINLKDELPGQFSVGKGKERRRVKRVEDVVLKPKKHRLTRPIARSSRTHEKSIVAEESLWTLH